MCSRVNFERRAKYQFTNNGKKQIFNGNVFYVGRKWNVHIAAKVSVIIMT